jgi:hypothetical protein
MKNSIIVTVIACLLIFFGYALGRVKPTDHSKCAKVSLPEEYHAITGDDTLRGYWNVDSDTLFVEYFNNRDMPVENQ